jgi:hypothetical protein
MDQPLFNQCGGGDRGAQPPQDLGAPPHLRCRFPQFTASIAITGAVLAWMAGAKWRWLSPRPRMMPRTLSPGSTYGENCVSIQVVCSDGHRPPPVHSSSAPAAHRLAFSLPPSPSFRHTPSSNSPNCVLAILWVLNSDLNLCWSFPSHRYCDVYCEYKFSYHAYVLWSDHACHLSLTILVLRISINALFILRSYLFTRNDECKGVNKLDQHTHVNLYIQSMLFLSSCYCVGI